nr:hypothetical protein [Streptomyces sp. MH191]
MGTGRGSAVVAVAPGPSPRPRTGRPRSSRRRSASPAAAGRPPPFTSVSATWLTASRYASGAYRESANTECGSGGSTSAEAVSHACRTVPGSTPGGADPAKSSKEPRHSRSEALAAAVSRPAGHGPGRVMSALTWSTVDSPLSDRATRPSPSSACARAAGPRVTPAAVRSRTLTVVSGAGPSGSPSAGRSSAPTWEAIHCRWAPSRCTTGAGLGADSGTAPRVACGEGAGTAGPPPGSCARPSPPAGRCADRPTGSVTSSGAAGSRRLPAAPSAPDRIRSASGDASVNFRPAPVSSGSARPSSPPFAGAGRGASRWSSSSSLP